MYIHKTITAKPHTTYIHIYQISNHFIDWIGILNTERAHREEWEKQRETEKKFFRKLSILQCSIYLIRWHFFFVLALLLDFVDICKRKPLNKIQWLYFVASKYILAIELRYRFSSFIFCMAVANILCSARIQMWIIVAEVLPSILKQHTYNKHIYL